jgi:hypothetical protein
VRTGPYVLRVSPLPALAAQQLARTALGCAAMADEPLPWKRLTDDEYRLWAKRYWILARAASACHMREHARVWSEMLVRLKEKQVSRP